MTDEERVMFTGLVSLRNNEISLRWTRTQLFFLINSGGLSLVVTQFKNYPLTSIVACIFGLYLCSLWRELTMIIRRWVNFWSARLSDLEKQSSPSVTIFSGKLYESAMKSVTAHEIILKLISVFTFVWSLVGLLSIVTFLKEQST